LFDFAGSCRTRRRRSLRAGTAWTRFFFFFGNDGTCDAWARSRGLVAETLARFLLGLFLGFFVVRAALVFFRLARFSGIAFDFFDRLALGAALGFLDRFAAFMLFALARVDQRSAAGVALFVGQRAQHHAARRGGPRGRYGSRFLFRRRRGGGGRSNGSLDGRSRAGLRRGARAALDLDHHGF
jgi:hypothetical protein